MTRKIPLLALGLGMALASAQAFAQEYKDDKVISETNETVPSLRQFFIQFIQNYVRQ